MEKLSDTQLQFSAVSKEHGDTVIESVPMDWNSAVKYIKNQVIPSLDEFNWKAELKE